MLKKYHYVVSTFLVLITLLGTFLGSSGLSNQAEAATISVSGLTAQDAKITTVNGRDVTNSTSLDSYSSYKVTYNWTIADDVALKNGDTFNFELPNNVQVKDTPLVIEMTTPTHQRWGTAEIKPGASSGVITITNVDVLQRYGRKGTLVLNVNGKNNDPSDHNIYPRDWILNKVGWTTINAQGEKLVHWQVVYNQLSKNVKDIQIADHFSNGQSYVPNSLTISTGSVDDTNHFHGTGRINATDLNLKDHNLSLNIASISQAIALDYFTKPDANFFGTLKNSVTVTGTFVTDKDSKTITSGPVDVTVPWGGQGDGDGYNGKVTLTKVNAKDPNKVLAGAVFELVNTDTHKTLNSNLITNQKGKIEVDNLPKGNYAFKEIKAPEGYELSNQEYKFTITGDKLVDIGKIKNTPSSTTPNVPVVPDYDKVISISGKKIWNDNNDQDKIRPKQITIHLLANGKVIQTKTVTQKDDWRYSFDNLPKKENGQKINYEVREDPVAGYQSKVDGYDITNSHLPTLPDIVVPPVIPNDTPNVIPVDPEFDLPDTTPPLPTKNDDMENTIVSHNSKNSKEIKSTRVAKSSEVITIKPHSNTGSVVDHLLPKTGKKILIYPIVVGAILLLIAGIIVIKKRIN